MIFQISSNCLYLEICWRLIGKLFHKRGHPTAKLLSCPISRRAQRAMIILRDAMNVSCQVGRCKWSWRLVYKTHLRALANRQAAAFCTDCTFLSRFSGTPYRSESHQSKRQAKNAWTIVLLMGRSGNIGVISKKNEVLTEGMNKWKRRMTDASLKFWIRFVTLLH